MHPRCCLVQYLPAKQNSGTSMEVSSRWFCCCISVEQAGPDYPGCATCCTECDHPRQSCISRCTAHWWCWSWRGGILSSSNGFVLLILFYVRTDGKQIVLMQGPAAPFPIPGAYHINRYIGIGLLFHNIFPICPSILKIVMTFESGYRLGPCL